MPTLNKRVTVYFDPDIHKVLKIKAAETSKSISEIVDDAIRIYHCPAGFDPQTRLPPGDLQTGGRV